MKTLVLLLLGAALSGTGMSIHAKEEPKTDGVKVGEASAFRKLVSAESLEKQATQQYAALTRDAAGKKALAPDNHPQVIRLRAIAKKMLPHTLKWNPRAKDWKWEVNLLGGKQINAFCMPGGKIAFYYGILETLKLTDDEVAVVMGHEIAHALREHAREQAGKNAATKGVAIVGSLLTGGKYDSLIGGSANLLSLSYSRSDETDADLVGLELTARAGYDPRAGVTLWEKMGAASKGAPPQFMSTHPSGKNRIAEIKKHLPEVMPIYEKARVGLK